jgi:IS5 family transposase
VIAARRLQRNFADGFIAEAVEDLWEPWMRHADTALEDDALLLIIRLELAKRCKKSKTRGRKATPAEVVLRMLLLKHVRDWSYEVLSREVRANLVYREFTRIGGEKLPDDKTMGNLARQLGPEVIEKVHRRVVEIARENKIATGRKMRVDTTVVETDIHYPTDSTLLGDGVRVLTRVMKKVTAVAGKAGTQMRDRSRSAKLKVLAIARASRNKTEQGRQKMKQAYLKLLEITSRVVGQAKKFSREIARRVKRGNLSVLHKAQKQLDAMIPRVQQVLRQTRERVLRGNTQADGVVARQGRNIGVYDIPHVGFYAAKRVIADNHDGDIGRLRRLHSGVVLVACGVVQSDIRAELVSQSIKDGNRVGQGPTVQIRKYFTSARPNHCHGLERTAVQWQQPARILQQHN